MSRELKKKIRKEILRKRKSLDPRERLELSRLVLERLFSLEEFREAKKVFLYVSKADEVDTVPLIRTCLEEGKEVFAPFVRGSDMDFARVSSVQELVKGRFGILEPKNKEPVPPETADIVVVPGVVFDEKGHRIGRGKGYYDRYLKRVPREVPRVALAFDFQVLPEIPSAPSDEKVDIIVTEKRIIRAKS